MTGSKDVGSCPVEHHQKTHTSTVPTHGLSSDTAAGSCPVDHSHLTRTEPLTSELNPLNMMPNLSQNMVSGQTRALSTERTLSGIPKSKNNHWEYPSPQQFYSALKRKGKEAPESEISTMVDIHNFLNEACWEEIMKWESKYHCDCKNVRLAKFQGRPDDLSPKAWFYTTFRGVEQPFDRHDWTINRCGTDVRYVIDYYSGPDDGDSPVFNVDVRPALDSPVSIFDRVRAGLGKMWENISN